MLSASSISASYSQQLIEGVRKKASARLSVGARRADARFAFRAAQSALSRQICFQLMPCD
ncbi:hypothetical protein D6817_00130 [Candidatus Pacearchaeota archaeon]|nr:MAG: hypothetical protein D6817_00130 [Candidatus Pacearchaeota archaeon]